MHHSRYEYTQAMMGTTVSLMLFEPNETVVQHVFNTINQLENKLTVNRPVSEVMSINNAAGKHPIRVSHAVYSLIGRLVFLDISSPIPSKLLKKDL